MLASARHTSESSHTCVQLGRRDIHIYIHVFYVWEFYVSLRDINKGIYRPSFQRDQNRKIIRLFGKRSLFSIFLNLPIRDVYFPNRLNTDTDRGRVFSRKLYAIVDFPSSVALLKKEREKNLDTSRRTIHFSIFSSFPD